MIHKRSTKTDFAVVFLLIWNVLFISEGSFFRLFQLFYLASVFLHYVLSKHIHYDCEVPIELTIVHVRNI